MLANLIGELAKRRITNQELADLLGIHRNSVSNKLYGMSEFTLREAITIYDKYFSDCDFRWLFTHAAA